MQITAEPREGYTILHLRGEFDTYYCPHLQKEIDSLISGGVKRVALNLRLVKFINSTALGAIIKASKSLSGQGGRLAIARPSAFVRDIISKVGLDRVVPVFDTDEDAGTHLIEAAPSARVESEDNVLDDESSVLFTPVDSERIEHFVPEANRSAGTTNPVHGHAFGTAWRGVGRMSALDATGITFVWGGGSTKLSPFEMGQMLALGIDLKVKFRLPLLQKGHCEATVTISEVEERPDGVKIGASFSEIEASTRAAVQQYAEDLAFLKAELRKATSEE